MKSKSYFFPEPIQRVNLTIPRDSVWHSLNSLSELNCVHLSKPKNPTLNTAESFAPVLKRAHDLLSKIELIKECVNSFSQMNPSSYVLYPNLLQEIDGFIRTKNIEGQLFINEVADEIEEVSAFLNSQNKDYEAIKN